jgi:AcrR family transcriptional regulator
MPPETRQRLVSFAVKRFYRDGFRNVGLDQVLDDVGISKTAFYKHFDSKDSLMLAALEAQNVWLQNEFRQMIRKAGGLAAADQLRALFDVVDQILESDNYQGCIFINAAVEFPLPHSPAHIAATENKQAILEIVYELAERAGAADPEALSEELCMIMDGAYVGRQVMGEPGTIRIARGLAERAIQAHLDPDPARAGGASEPASS